MNKISAANLVVPKSATRAVKPESEDNRKFKFTDELIETPHGAVRRIQALRDIPEINVRKGDLGGCLENEEQLSQDGTCWVMPSSKVYGRSRILNRAYVGENCMLNHVLAQGDTRIIESVMRGVNMSGTALVEFSSIIGDFEIHNEAEIRNCELKGSGYLAGTSRIHLQNREFQNVKFLDLDVTRHQDVIEILGVAASPVLILSCTDNVRVVWGTEVISSYKVDRTLKRYRVLQPVIGMILSGVKILEQRNDISRSEEASEI